MDFQTNIVKLHLILANVNSMTFNPRINVFFVLKKCERRTETFTVASKVNGGPHNSKNCFFFAVISKELATNKNIQKMLKG